MPKFTYKLKKKDIEDPNGPRRPPHVVAGVAGGGSPYGSTTYKRARLCPFEDALVSVARLRPDRNKEPLDVGWIVHLCWEAYYKVIKNHQDALGDPPPRADSNAWEHYFWGAIPAAERAVLEILTRFEEEPGYGRTIEACTRVINAYMEYYRRQDTWRILAVEETLVIEQPLARAYTLIDQDGDKIVYDLWQYSCRLDLLIEDWKAFEPELWVVEGKTAKMLSEDLLSGYQLDMQILGQAWLFENCVDLSKYAPYKGVIVNIVTKHMQPKCERLQVCPSREHLAEFERSTKQWGLSREVNRALGHPRSLGSCAGALRGYAKCAYYELCHSRPSWGIADFERNDPPPGFFRDERPYQDESDYEDYA